MDVVDFNINKEACFVTCEEFIDLRILHSLSLGKESSSWRFLINIGAYQYKYLKKKTWLLPKSTKLKIFKSNGRRLDMKILKMRIYIGSIVQNLNDLYFQTWISYYFMESENLIFDDLAAKCDLKIFRVKVWPTYNQVLWIMLVGPIDVRIEIRLFLNHIVFIFPKVIRMWL